MKVGIGLLLFSIAGAILFQQLVVLPLSQVSADGSHGELYGPISFIKYFVYALLLICLSSGVSLVCRKKKE